MALILPITNRDGIISTERRPTGSGAVVGPPADGTPGDAPPITLAELSGADDLRAIEALTTTGYLKRTGSNAWALASSIPGSDITSLPWSKITSTPTTLAGYGITNGQPLAAILTALSALSNASGVLTNDGSGGLTWAASGGGGTIGGSTGSTDNVLLRADGTGGATLQNSTASLDDNGILTLVVNQPGGLTLNNTAAYPPFVRFQLGATDKAFVGVSYNNDDLNDGSTNGDLNFRLLTSGKAFLFSADNGTTNHVKITSSSVRFASYGTGIAHFDSGGTFSSSLIVDADVTAVGWSKLTSRPAVINSIAALTDSAGVLTNDGLGNLSWSAVGGGSITGTVGTTDNALVRADGTGGSTAQGSPATLSDSGILTIVGSQPGGLTLNNTNAYPPFVLFQTGSSNKGFVGVAYASNDINDTSTGGDMCFRVVDSGKAFIFSADNGTTPHLRVAAAGVRMDGYGSGIAHFDSSGNITSSAVVNGDITSLAWSKLTSTPTTLAGYGITDAQPLDSDLTTIAALTTTSYGRSFLTQANAAAAATYIGLGTGNTPTFSGLNLAPSAGNSVCHFTSPSNSNYVQFVFDGPSSYEGYVSYIGSSVGLGGRDNTVELGSRVVDVTIRPGETEVVRITSGGLFSVNGRLQTASPTGGVAQPWKLGGYTAGTVTHTGTVRVEINGTAYDMLVKL